MDIQLDAVIQAALPVIPAVSLAVWQGGETRLVRAWGQLDPEAGSHPATPAALFDLASLTKLYTTTALLALLSREKLDLHTPLPRLLPEFGRAAPRGIDGGQDPHSKQKPPAAPDLSGQKVDPAQVTLWHLLTHTSGLPPWRDVYTVAPAPLPPTEPDPIPRHERWSRALSRLVAYPFVDRVGAAVRYSDIGLMLLGEVCARLQGSDLDSAIRALVLDPLELAHTCFNPVCDAGCAEGGIAPTEFDATWRKRRIRGEVHDENACGVGGVAGHAGLFAPVAEVLGFGVAWLQQDARLNIDAALWESATREQAVTGGERRGLGWMLPTVEAGISSAGDRMSRAAYGHTGFTGTSLWVDPSRDLVVALLTNRVYVGRDVPGIHALRREVHDTVVEAIV